MRALVVIAAAPGTIEAELAEAAVTTLARAGHDVHELDLHAIGFEPAMTAEERRAYHSDAPICDPVVAEHAALVRWADALVFVYPTVLGGVPALLKGWLDRVMVKGVAFELDDGAPRPRPLLRHVRRLVGISTYPTSRARTFVLADAGRRTIMRTLRLVCAPTVRCRWVAHHPSRSTARSVIEVERTMVAL
jgi:NAD(P)H dehydrogenase (quinone)